MAGHDIHDPPILGYLVVACHTVGYLLLMASTAVLGMPSTTRMLNIAAHVSVILGFWLFGRCWLLELEKQLFHDLKDHLVLQFFYLFPRGFRKVFFFTAEGCALAWSLTMFLLGI